MRPIIKKYPQTEQELLDSTCWWYNSNRRSFKDTGVCSYAKNGCAIGVYEPLTNAEYLDRYADGELDSIDIHTEMIPFLTSPLKNMNLLFLKEIQSLHDCEIFWDFEGLSLRGERNVEYIAKTYRLNVPLPAPEIHPYLEIPKQ